MTPARRRAVMVALAGAVALVVVLVLARSSQDAVAVSPAPTAPTPSAQVAETATPTTVVAPKAPFGQHAAGSADATGPSVDDVMKAQTSGAIDVLIDGLSSSDGVVVAEAANGLVARNAVVALPSLVEIDVAARPWVAPSVIHAMAELGAKAEPEQKSEVVDRLLSLLASEKKRPSNEALANLLYIYEALGKTGDPRAIGPLEAELLDATVATSPKVVVVQALVALGARQSRPTLEKLRDQIAPLAVGPDFEAELRRDLLAAIQAALASLA